MGESSTNVGLSIVGFDYKRRVLLSFTHIYLEEGTLGHNAEGLLSVYWPPERLN